MVTMGTSVARRRSRRVGPALRTASDRCRARPAPAGAVPGAERAQRRPRVRGRVCVWRLSCPDGRPDGLRRRRAGGWTASPSWDGEDIALRRWIDPATPPSRGPCDPHWAGGAVGPRGGPSVRRRTPRAAPVGVSPGFHAELRQVRVRQCLSAVQPSAVSSCGAADPAAAPGVQVRSPVDRFRRVPRGPFLRGDGVEVLRLQLEGPGLAPPSV